MEKDSKIQLLLDMQEHPEQFSEQALETMLDDPEVRELMEATENALLGIVGGVVGGFLGGLIGIGADGWLSSILLAIGGSCVVVWLARKIAR